MQTTTLYIYCHADHFSTGVDLTSAHTREVTRSATVGELRKLIKSIFRLEEPFEVAHGLTSLAEIDNMVLLEELHFDHVETLFVRRPGQPADALQRVYCSTEGSETAGISEDIRLLLLSENISLLFQIITKESSLQGTAVSRR